MERLSLAALEDRNLSHENVLVYGTTLGLEDAERQTAILACGSHGTKCFEAFDSETLLRKYGVLK